MSANQAPNAQGRRVLNASIGAELVRWQVVAGIESMTALLLVIFIVVAPFALYFILSGEKRNDRDRR